MKLFRDKNRGPKTRREDVQIPEEYLEYERQAEEKRRMADSFLTIDEMDFETSEETSPEEEQILPEEPSFSSIDELTSIHEAQEVETIAFDDDPYEQVSKRERKKREKKAKNKESKQRQTIEWRFVGLMALITLIVAGMVCLLGPIMAIDRVEVNGTKNLTEKQVLEIAEYPQSHNLFLYRTSKAKKELRLHPYVKNVKIRRHFPHWLSIDIEERTPAGILLDNGHYIQFSKDGILLDNTNSLLNPSLPIITGFSMRDIPAPGEHFRDNDRFKDALKIVNACSDDLLPMIQEINIKDRQNILAYTNQGIEIRLGSIKRIKSRMDALDDIMKQVILSNTVEEPIEALDIRYEKSPVIVLKGYHDAAEENKQKYIAEERAKIDAEKKKSDSEKEAEDKAQENSTAQTTENTSEMTTQDTPSA